MRKSYLKKMATKSLVGRVLRRLLGEEKGAVMMEYIVIALLIAAAVVIAVSAFGRYASDLFGVLGFSMGGRSTAAKESLSTADQTFNENVSRANEHAKSVHDQEVAGEQLDTTARGGGAGN